MIIFISNCIIFIFLINMLSQILSFDTSNMNN